jgi:lysophospholipase L1-like esterase
MSATAALADPRQPGPLDLTGEIAGARVRARLRPAALATALKRKETHVKRRIALIGLVVGAALLAAPLATANEGTRYYVSLGDSLAAGVQPNGQPPFGETDEGYTDQLYAALKADDPKLTHIRLGCGGESTTSMVEGSQLPWVAFSCGPPDFYLHRYPHKTQLAEAVAFLHAHRQFVSLVTIDIGGNDVIGPGGAGEISENLPTILAQLREAAGPDVPIVGMNYYGPGLPGAWEQGGLPAVADYADALVDFNDFLEGFYTDAGMPVADVESAFSSTDLTLVGGVPRNVVLVCQWTWLCAPPPFGGDLHPNAAGYAVIARAFLDVLE